MHYFSVCSKRTYHTQKGIKHQVDQIGNIRITDDGNWYLTLFQHPDTQYKIFPSLDQKLPDIEA